MPAAILLPALLVTFRAERPLLAPAYRVDPVGGNAQRDKIVLGSLRAPLAEAQVVFRRAALVAVALDRNVNRRIGAQELRVLGQCIARVGTNIGFVEIEEGIAHVLLEELADSRGLSGCGGRNSRATGH